MPSMSGQQHDDEFERRQSGIRSLGKKLKWALFLVVVGGAAFLAMHVR